MKRQRPIIIRARETNWALCFYGMGLTCAIWTFFVATLHGAGVWRALPAFAGFLAIHFGPIALISFLSREQSFRLRLLPHGVRVTRGGSTTNLLEPSIVRPEECVQLSRILLRSAEKEIAIPLGAISRRNQAILLEHLSQFLTPEQQAAYGARWARQYAELITVPKPDDEPVMKSWRIICLAIGAAIVAVSFIQVTPNAANLGRIYPWILAVLVGLAPAVFSIVYGAFWVNRTFPARER